MRRYFAYGSNMWSDQMKERCPQSKTVGVARLLDYRWTISARGYANVVTSMNDSVEGVLFEISATDEASLDKYEGVSSGSYQKAELPVSHEGLAKVALVYVDPETVEGSPTQEYVQRINSGLADAKLSDAYITQYVRRYLSARPG
ncbi:MAG: gamma-glutamylcyclotransferase [Nitrospira sp. CR2.1]|nr:gamma-glutamylcyclotransferase [Nitrospira sp. CR2.1]